MPIVNVGSSCGVLATPTSPYNGFYFTNTTMIAGKTFVLDVSDSTGTGVGTPRVTEFSSSISLPTIDVGYVIKFGWDNNISAPVGSGGTTYTFSTGDIRLRYIYTGSTPTSFANYPVVYISGPSGGFSSSSNAGISFQLLSPSITVPGVTPSYVIGNGTGLTFNQSSTLPTITSASSYYFVNISYTSPGMPKFVLTSTGDEIDINRPLVDTSSLTKFAIVQTYSSGILKLTTSPSLSNGVPGNYTGPTPAGIPYQIVINSSKFYNPIGSIISADAESVSQNEISTIIINTPTTILSWVPGASSSAYTLGSFADYFAAIGANTPQRGYFNILPIGLEGIDTSVNTFLLASSDNAAIFYLDGTGLKSGPIPFANNSLGTLTSPNTLDNIGVWSLDYVLTTSPSIGSKFRLKYTIRAAAGSSTSFNTYYLTTVAPYSTSVLGSATQFTCTICTPLNGTCSAGGRVSDQPVMGVYVAASNGNRITLGIGMPGNPTVQIVYVAEQSPPALLSFNWTLNTSAYNTLATTASTVARPALATLRYTSTTLTDVNNVVYTKV